MQGDPDTAHPLSQGRAGNGIVAEVEQIQPSPPKREYKPTGRKSLPAELPRIEHRHEPESCTCGQCGRDLIKIGEDISEQLNVIPAIFTVHRHIRPTYACRACETLTVEAVPPAVIDGGSATLGLLAWVVVQKYLDHLPLYRIEQISERQGCAIARSTLAEWVGRIGVALQPLADRLAGLLRQQGVLHADETPIQQLDPGAGKTKRAYLWAYRSNDLCGSPPMVVFDYQTIRTHSNGSSAAVAQAISVQVLDGKGCATPVGMNPYVSYAHPLSPWASPAALQLLLVRHSPRLADATVSMTVASRPAANDPEDALEALLAGMGERIQAALLREMERGLLGGK